MKQYVQDRYIAVTGLVLVALGFWLCTDYTEDSALFPQICLTGIGILLVLLAVETVFTEKKEKAGAKRPVLTAKMQWGPFLLVTAALALYAAGTVLLGFYAASALFLLAVGFLWGGVKKPVILLFTAVFLVFLYVCFTILFNVPLPVGLLR